MQALDNIKSVFWLWLNLVAEATIGGLARLKKNRTVCLIEGDYGHFAVSSSDNNVTLGSGNLVVEDGHISGGLSAQLDEAMRGGRVELVLRSDRCLFKPLELPSRAAEFLGAIVQAQIDRLTPWSAEHAAFGFSKPVDAGSGRIAVTVAATAKEMLSPLLKAVTETGAKAIAISTNLPDAADDEAPITIVEENIGRTLNVHAVCRILLAVLVSTILVAMAASVAALIIDGGLQDRRDELERRIVQRRTAVLTARNAPGDPKALAERGLAQRKNKSPSDIIAIDILSQILPDHTYVTELHIEADKLRLTGITHDAPGLIRLIEQTKHFSQATFFAPITRSSSESGDRFNIEARMEPDFSLTP